MELRVEWLHLEGSFVQVWRHNQLPLCFDKILTSYQDFCKKECRFWIFLDETLQEGQTVHDLMTISTEKNFVKGTGLYIIFKGQMIWLSNFSWNITGQQLAIR